MLHVLSCVMYIANLYWILSDASAQLISNEGGLENWKEVLVVGRSVYFLFGSYVVCLQDYMP